MKQSKKYNTNCILFLRLMMILPVLLMTQLPSMDAFTTPISTTSTILPTGTTPIWKSKIMKLPSSSTSSSSPPFHLYNHLGHLFMNKDKNDDDINVSVTSNSIISLIKNPIIMMMMMTPWKMFKKNIFQKQSSSCTTTTSNSNRIIHRFVQFLIIQFSIYTLFLSSCNAVESGGRIGGGSFRNNNRQRYSSSSSSPSLSPKMRNYSSRMNNNRNDYYGRSRMNNNNNIQPYYNRGSSSTTTIWMNPFTFSSWNPFYSYPYQPIVGGGGGGGTAVVVTRTTTSPVELLVMGGIVYFMVQGLFKNKNIDTNSDRDDSMMMEESILGKGISLTKISIAIQVPNRDDPSCILQTLQQIASTTTDTTITKSEIFSLQQMIHQVVLELLRKKQYIAASSTQYKHFHTLRDVQKEYNQWSIEERSKFDHETVNKYNGRDLSTLKSTSSTSSSSSTLSTRATYAVVTILLAITGDTTILPPIRSATDVETALKRIAIDSQVENCILSTELLWTPTDEKEVLTKKEILMDYPDLIFI